MQGERGIENKTTKRQGILICLHMCFSEWHAVYNQKIWNKDKSYWNCGPVHLTDLFIRLKRTVHIVSWPDRTRHPNLPNRSCWTGLNPDKHFHFFFIIINFLDWFNLFLSFKVWCVPEGKCPVSGQSGFWKFAGLRDRMWCLEEPYIQQIKDY